jgi:hypothetical protein
MGFPLELAADGGPTWDEWRELKRLSGGVLPAEFDQALGNSDPDAWRAYVLVSVRRSDPRAKDNLLDGLDFIAILADWWERRKREVEQREAEAVAQGPPAVAAGTPPSPSSPPAPENGQSANERNSSPPDGSPNAATTPEPTGTSISS